MKRNILTILLTLSLFITSAWANEVHAQYFKFNLKTPQAQVAVGQPAELSVLINTTGQQAINGDVLFTFDPAAVTINSAKNAEPVFFTYFSASPLGGAANKYLLSSWEESVAHAKSSTTDTVMATINFTLKSSCATLTFDCTAGTESDSNINRASDSKDIIACPLTPLTVCGAGSSTIAPTATTAPTTPTVTVVATATPTATRTPTPQATSTPIPTNTPRPTVSELPRTGAAEVTMLGLGIGTLFVIAGVMLFAL
jgi:hypothetical protein